MAPERWAAVERLFLAASVKPANERAAFLAEACGGDEALREEVTSLLRHASAPAAFDEGGLAVVAGMVSATIPLTGRQLGGYDVVALLGTGAMGEVYRARDRRLEREVAIKVLPSAFTDHPERRARFEREARALAALNHRNIATIHSFEELDGRAVLVMELVPGDTLRDRIRRGPVPRREALEMAIQMADALEAAHEHGIVHRDLKPANIKIAPDGTVKVLDFGLAKTMAPEASAVAGPIEGTREGLIVGTPAYMSPEQARGRPVDKRTDIWAFGCVLYEMLTGRAAFHGEDVSLTLSNILQRDPDWSIVPAAAGDAVRSLLGRCLDKEPKTRLRDIGEARIVLEGLRTNENGPPPRAPSLQRRSGRSAVMLATAILAAAAGAVIGAALNSTRGAGNGARPVRLSAVLPTGDQLVGRPGLTWHPLAISPDGTQLAYADGERLRLRSLNDSFEFRTVLGSEGASSPFFSADGEWVGFSAQGQLRKLSVRGGRAESLAGAAGGLGATWTPDGLIYFARSSGLWKVAAAGGVPQPVTTLNRAAGEVSHRWPQALPGRTAILYTVWKGPGWDEKELHVYRPDTGLDDTVVTGGSTGRYVRTGHLLYSRAGELMAVPFDVERLEVTGAPVSTGILVREREGAYYAVADTGVLAMIEGGSRPRRELVEIALDGAATTLPAMPRGYTRIDTSPDGQRAALTVTEESSSIWMYDFSRGTQTLFARSSQFPTWTADGQQVIYRGTRSGFRNLYRRLADGSGAEERLTNSENVQTPLSMSPDGKWLTFNDVDPETGVNVWLLSLEGRREPKPLLTSPAIEDNARFSPDGRWLAYSSDESGRNEIYVQPFPGPGTRLTVSTGGGAQPQWSADGRALFFLQGQSVMVVDVVPGPTLRIGAPRRLFTGSGYLENYSLHPDGTRLFRVRDPEVADSSTRIQVILNWTEELTRLVRTR